MNPATVLPMSSSGGAAAAADRLTGTDDVQPNPGDACSIAASLDIVGDRWTILILRDAFRGLRRFDEFRRDLDIPRAVLADRLRRLVEAGVMVKRVYQERPVRHEYRLTRMGIELSPILVALMQWGDRWLSEDGAPTLLVHEPCGTEVDLGFHCWTCQRSYTPTEIASRPGHPDTAPSPQTRSATADAAD
jgi:DNA-binding HxlR family transcriptional regulator